MFGFKKIQEQLTNIEEQLKQPVVETRHVKLVNFYTAIFDDEVSSSGDILTGSLLDYAGREFTFEWDNNLEHLISLDCPEDDILTLRWELAERYLEDQLIDSEEVTVELQYPPQGPENIPQPSLPPIEFDQAVPASLPDPEPQDLSDDEISHAFENLSPQDFDQFSDTPLSIGDRVVLESDYSVKGMINDIQGETAIVAIDHEGVSTIPLGDLTHETNQRRGTETT